MAIEKTIEIKRGTYNLKNWEYFLELSCYKPGIIIGLIMSAANYGIKDERSFGPDIEINSGKFKCAKSRPGLQYILANMIIPRLEEPTPNKFDEILERLDSLLSNIKNRCAYSHTTSLEPLFVIKEDIYHMRNWEIFIDLTCYNPDYIIEIIMDAIKEYEEESFEKRAEEYGIFTNMIGPHLNIINCARTIEGLETMLLLLLKDVLKTEIDPSFFDKVLKKLDSYLDNIKSFYLVQ